MPKSQPGVPRRRDRCGAHAQRSLLMSAVMAHKSLHSRASIAVIGLMLIAFRPTSANAEQPPHKRCVAVSKGEYQAAKKKNLLRAKYGTYVRTGWLWRPYYWYCRR